MKLPVFKNKASCVGTTTPDDWFPDDDSNSYSPESMRARNACLNCEAYDECLAYSLRFKDLDGIWANLDSHERRTLQRRLRLRNLETICNYAIPIPQVESENTQDV